MKVLTMFEYPPVPAGLSTQGDLFYRGLQAIGIDTQAVHFESSQEKEWYYRWYQPDVAVGVGFWGFSPQLIQHPQKFGVQPIPWLVADGYIANYREELDALPLLLVTSNWVKEVYVRDGIKGDHIEALPVGCDTDVFVPRDKRDPKVAIIREALGVAPDELMILTVGGGCRLQGWARGYAGAGTDQGAGAAVEIRLQGLAATADRVAEYRRPTARGEPGDRKAGDLCHQPGVA